MDIVELNELIQNNIKPTLCLKNPGGGISFIRKVTKDSIVYSRGDSAIKLPIKSFLDVCTQFSGKNARQLI